MDGGPRILAIGGGCGVRQLGRGPPRKKLSIMLTTREQQELCQIEHELRDTDRGFAWRLAVLQGVLRWAGPGRQAYLLALAVLAAALLRVAAAAGRLLMACAKGAMLLEPTALMALGDTAWPGWDSGPGPGHNASPAQDRPQSDRTDQP